MKWPKLVWEKEGFPDWSFGVNGTRFRVEIAPMANSSFIARSGWEKTGRAYELLEISLSEGLRDSWTTELVPRLCGRKVDGSSDLGSCRTLFSTGSEAEGRPSGTRSGRIIHRISVCQWDYSRTRALAPGVAPVPQGDISATSSLGFWVDFYTWVAVLMRADFVFGSHCADVCIPRCAFR